jgi:phage-related minor tail protein
MTTALSNLLALLALDESAYLQGLDNSKKATDSFAGNLANVGGAIAVGAITLAATAITAVGVAAFDAAETVDEAFDSIAVATGAQGDDLLQLQEDWKVVFATVPVDATVAADAIGILNSRLGLTGVELQNLAIPLLEVSRILGTDINQNAEEFTRVLGDWNLPLEDASAYLDALFVASQQTGADLNTLMQQIVQYGAPMRNFGFSFEEAGALLASFAAQGVNTEIIMGGLRIAQGKFIDQGKDMNTGLWETVDAIQNAASQTDALAIATEIFGAKAAGDMVDTIRSGKFNIDALVDSMMNADGAIMDAADATSDWGETWKTFQNNMTLALAPIGDKLREGFGTALDSLVETFNRPDVQASITAFADFAVVTISKIVENIPAFIAGVESFFAFLQANQGVVIGVFATLGVAAVAWGITTATAAVTAITPMLPVIGVILLIAAAAYLLYEAWTNNWGGIQEIVAQSVANIQGFIQALIDFFVAVWNNPLIQSVVQTALSNIQAIFAAFKAAFNGDWHAFGENLRIIWDNNWKLVGTVLTAAWETIKSIVINGIATVKNIFTQTNWVELGTNIARGIANGIANGASAIINAAKSAASAALEAAKGFLGISSPSRVFEMQVGYMMAAGVAEGWSSGIDRLLAPAMSDLSPANVNIQPTGNAQVSGTSQPQNNDAMLLELLEEINRRLRDLPEDIARAINSAMTKKRTV